MKVIGITEQFTKKDIYIPSPDDLNCQMGEHVVYLDEESRENLGVLFCDGREKKIIHADNMRDNYSFLRKATGNDIQKSETHNKLSDKARGIFLDYKEKHKLDMKLAFTEYSLDGNRVNFIYTADDRVDFRELVKDLAKSLKKQIHLQQIGPRDLSKILGGMGKCGREKCCTWLPKLESISMDMVRAQGLESRGVSKLTGVCGKLRCCIKFEVYLYKELRKNLPAVGNIIKFKKEEAKVIGLDVLNQKVKIITSSGEYMVINHDEVNKIISRDEVKDTQDPILT